MKCCEVIARAAGQVVVLVVVAPTAAERRSGITFDYSSPQQQSLSIVVDRCSVAGHVHTLRSTTSGIGVSGVGEVGCRGFGDRPSLLELS